MGEQRITNLRIIKHFKSGNNFIHGIYECDFNGQKTVFIRHGNDIASINFHLGEPLRKCFDIVTESVATELVNEVEFRLMIAQSVE